MKTIMMVTREDFKKKAIVNNDFVLCNLKKHCIYQEINFDIITFIDDDKAITLKNRFGSIDSINLEAFRTISY